MGFYFMIWFWFCSEIGSEFRVSFQFGFLCALWMCSLDF